jgi:folate-dependent tRNA-U54 methylase TrmFO/GidA
VTAARAPKERFVPTNINFGLLPPPDERVKKKDRRAWQVQRAERDLDRWLGGAAGPTGAAVASQVPGASAS